MSYGPINDEYVTVTATRRRVQAIALNDATRTFVGIDCNGATAVYGYDEVERYMGIDPPPEFMDAEQFAGLMTNYD